MTLYKYLNTHGLMKLDILVRIGSVKIVYKGKRAFVYPK